MSHFHEGNSRANQPAFHVGFLAAAPAAPRSIMRQARATLPRTGHRRVLALLRKREERLMSAAGFGNRAFRRDVSRRSLFV